MAEGDRQLAFTTGPVPTSVQVSGPDRITPKAVNASFDGTGAAGAFLPCLIITGRTGLEVARIPAPQVAAGASAEVSWFPRVGGGSTAPPTALTITDEYPIGAAYSVPGDGTGAHPALWGHGTGNHLLDYSVAGVATPLVSGIYAITINIAMVTAVYNKPSVMTTLLHVDHIGLGWQTYQKAVCVLATNVFGSAAGVESPATVHTLPPLELHTNSQITVDTRQGSGGALDFALAASVSKLD